MWDFMKVFVEGGGVRQVNEGAWLDCEARLRQTTQAACVTYYRVLPLWIPIPRFPS